MKNRLLISIVVLGISAAVARGESPATAPLGPNPNVAMPTLGGEQFWSDELVFRDWRIQQNVLTSHYRLLDGHDVRRAWGTFEQCQAALDEAKQREQLPTLKGRAVLTLHGLIRSRDHMIGIGEYLEANGGFTWMNVSYASTRRSLDEHAQSLARVIAGLEGIDEIYLVCHSLGNLVVRRYIGEANAQAPRWQPDPRIKRMVMLGPPNNGAQIAKFFRNNELYGLVTGPSGKQLARAWNETQLLLATPSFPFGILAGGCGDERGINPLLRGDDDFVVSVEETRLPGASDFRVVSCRHGLLMDDPTVREYVLSFLKTGSFTTEQQRQPIATLGKIAQ